MAGQITPFIKRLRVNGATILTFSSSVEDIGLNINNLNNVVEYSHFALLNLPAINFPANINENKFNPFAISTEFGELISSNSVKSSQVFIAESFQNYALNLESNLQNLDSYNPALSATVSERVFWKWLKETGAIRWQQDASSGYWVEESLTNSSTGYSNVVQYVGEINAASLVTNKFGTFNECMLLIPTSHKGNLPVWNQQIDDNYYPELVIPNGGANILGRESFTGVHPDALSFSAYYDQGESSTNTYPDTSYSLFYDNSTGVGYKSGQWFNAEAFNVPVNSYILDSSSYVQSKIYNTKIKYTNGSSTFEFLRSSVDCLSLETNAKNIGTKVFNDPNTTFDTLSTTYGLNTQFNFNAVLLYYSVYDKTLQNK